MNLNQITLPSLDLSISIPFYEKLGLELIVHTHDDYARFVCPDGLGTLSLHRVDKLPEGEGIMVYFEEENLDAFCDHLIRQGITLKEMPNDKHWLWREAHLSDPDENHLVLFYAGKNRLNPPWRKKG